MLDDEGVGLGGGKDHGELVNVGLLSGEVASELLGVEVGVLGLVVLLVPLCPPDLGLGCEGVFADEGTYTLEVLDKGGALLGVIGGSVVGWVGYKLPFLLGIDEEATGGETPTYHVVWEVAGNPSGGSAGNDIDPRVLDLVIAGGLCTFLKGARLTVPEAYKYVDHLAVGGVEEVTEFGRGDGDTGHGEIDLLLGPVDHLVSFPHVFDELLPGYDVWAEVDAGNFFEEVHADGCGGTFTDDSRWGDQYDVLVAYPLELLHVDPDPTAKCSSYGGDPRPEVEREGGFTEGGEIDE